MPPAPPPAPGPPPSRGFAVRQTTPGAPSPAAQRCAPASSRRPRRTTPRWSPPRRRSCRPPRGGTGGPAGRLDGGAQHVVRLRAPTTVATSSSRVMASSSLPGASAAAVARHGRPSGLSRQAGSARRPGRRGRAARSPTATSKRTPTTPTTKTKASAHSRTPGTTRTKNRRRKPSHASRRRMPEPRASSSR